MKTPVYTISGFLGAGKTTFVNGLLSRLPGNVNVAIIVNELGEIHMYGRIIEKKDYSLSGLQMEDFNKGLNKSELVLIVKDKDREYLEASIPDGFSRYL